MKVDLLLFLKGCFMGVCDLIPGVSGGTIAFVTGIYPRLIKSLKNLFSYLILTVAGCLFSLAGRNRKEAKENFAADDLKFLLTLFLGIIFSLFLFSRLINFFLSNYFVYTLSFFLGLIVASLKMIFKKIERQASGDYFFAFLGLITGGLFVILTPFSLEPSYFYLFLGGFLAVNAMFLPGISGAFILLILGLYEYMIKVLADLPANLNSFFIFSLGALLGAFTISKIITFLFEKQKNKTLVFLLGLLLGSLGVPIQRIIQAKPKLDCLNILLIVSFFLLGGLIFFVFNLIAEKKYENN